MVKERFLREAMNFAGGDKFAGRRKEMQACKLSASNKCLS